MTNAASLPSQHRMAVLAYPDVQILDVVGPLQVFCHAGYAVEIIGVEAGPVRTSSGMQLVAERGIGDVAGGIDTLLVAGGNGFAGPDAQMDLGFGLGWEGLHHDFSDGQQLDLFDGFFFGGGGQQGGMNDGF